MKGLRAARIIIVSVSVAFALVYAVGAFGNASFDIREWNPTGRGILAMVAGVFSFVVVAAMTEKFDE